jgi:hypothetical protein
MVIPVARKEWQSDRRVDSRGGRSTPDHIVRLAARHSATGKVYHSGRFGKAAPVAL